MLSGEGHGQVLAGISFVPGAGLGADYGGHVGELAHHAAKGVNGVSAGDGQGVGAELVVALPGAPGVAGQDALAHQPHVAGHHPPHIAVRHQVAEVHDGGISAGL